MSNFAQPVSMPCTQEQYERDLRQPLLDLGYEEYNMTRSSANCNVLRTCWRKDNQLGIGYDNHKTNNHIPNYNPHLFLAIAAMREGEEIHVGEYVKIMRGQSVESQALDGQIKRVKAVSKHGLSKFGNGNLDVYDGIGGGIHLNEVRKATLQELIDKFGEKESAAVPFVPKRGDVVYFEMGTLSCIAIISEINNKRATYMFSFMIQSGRTYLHGYVFINVIQRFATDSEKQLLFDALAKQGKRYNEKEFCIEDIPAEVEKINYEKYIGREVIGFKFIGRLGLSYHADMCPYEGKHGTISEHDTITNSFRVEFKDDHWNYPADLVIEQLERKVEPVNPHQSMIDEWEASGRTKIIQSKQLSGWKDIDNPQWDTYSEYRFKPEEPKESVPARPLMVKSPISVNDSETKLTKDKSYEVISYCSDGGFYIKDDSSTRLYCLEKGCAHLDGGNWLVLQREGEPEPKEETPKVENWHFDFDVAFPNTKDHMAAAIAWSLLSNKREKETPKDLPSYAKVLAHAFVDETTDFKEAFRLLELVRQEVEQIHQQTIATKTKERDKLTAEIKKLKRVTIK